MHRVEPVWGTVVSIDVTGHDGPSAGPLGPAVDDVVAWFHTVDDLFSTWRTDSEVSRVASGALALDDASAEVREVLRTCDELRAATSGCFDIRVGALAGVEPRPGRGPIDPSGFVKGWALERAATMLVMAGATALLLNAGGDVVARGCGSAGRPWRVGVRHPHDADAVMAVLEVHDGGVATSGCYERGDHIVDPTTGRPADAAISATVVGPDLGVADAWATALVVAGADGLSRLPVGDGYEGLVVTPSAAVVQTDGLAARRVA